MRIKNPSFFILQAKRLAGNSRSRDLTEQILYVPFSTLSQAWKSNQKGLFSLATYNVSGEWKGVLKSFNCRLIKASSKIVYTLHFYTFINY